MSLWEIPYQCSVVMRLCQKGISSILIDPLLRRTHDCGQYVVCLHLSIVHGLLVSYLASKKVSPVVQSTDCIQLLLSGF